MRSHSKPAAAPAREPIAANKILIRLAHCVVMYLHMPRQSTHAWHLLTRVKLSRCNQEHDLFSELLPQRNIAVLRERNQHRE
jgi:hypothetical protein